MAASCCVSNSTLLSSPVASRAACAVMSWLSSCASALLTGYSSGETFVDQTYRLLPHFNAGQRGQRTRLCQHDTHFNAESLPQQRAEFRRQLRIIHCTTGFHMHGKIVAAALVTTGHTDELPGKRCVFFQHRRHRLREHV